jgi:hypothetical protein
VWWSAQVCRRKMDLLRIDKRGASLIILQVRHMRFISQHTRWSSRQWAVTPLGITQ